MFDQKIEELMKNLNEDVCPFFKKRKDAWNDDKIVKQVMDYLSKDSTDADIEFSVKRTVNALQVNNPLNNKLKDQVIADVVKKVKEQLTNK
jgi:rubrerythrin